MQKLTPDRFKNLLAKLYAVYAMDYDNISTDEPGYGHVQIDGVTFKVGYVPNQDNRSMQIRK